MLIKQRIKNLEKTIQKQNPTYGGYTIFMEDYNDETLNCFSNYDDYKKFFNWFSSKMREKPIFKRIVTKVDRSIIEKYIDLFRQEND